MEQADDAVVSLRSEVKRERTRLADLEQANTELQVSFSVHLAASHDASTEDMASDDQGEN